MTVDYVSMMTDEELLYICHTLTGKFLKQHYTKSPTVFQRIAPRRYIKKLSEEDACTLTVRNKTDVDIGRHLVPEIWTHLSSDIGLGMSEDVGITATGKGVEDTAVA